MASISSDLPPSSSSSHQRLASQAQKKSRSTVEVENDQEVNDTPIEEVRLTVPIDDDPSLPCLTFRTWTLGITSCVLLSFVNQFFGYRQNAIGISSVCVQIVALPVGRLMAAALPDRRVRVPASGGRWSFTLNPGPFNIKEHVLITIFANAGAGGVYALGIITIVKAFYHRGISPAAGMLLSQSTQLLGYGWAGIFRKYLVDSPFMWWPSVLVQVSLFKAMHEKPNRPKSSLTRLQFFIIVFISSFSYYIIPSFFFPSISSISFVCFIWKKSQTANLLGSGLNGFGLGSIGVDWATASFLGSPLATPAFAIFNTLVGYVIFFYLLVPVSYWKNWFQARKFPLVTSSVFDSEGKRYNISRILDPKTFSIDYVEYEKYSKVHVSVVFAYVYGLSFATLMASVTHVVLFHGRSIYDLWMKTASSSSVTTTFSDVHSRIMKKNYKSVPQWWFLATLVTVLALSIYTCQGFHKQLQLPYWGIFLACAMAVVFILPVGVLVATTNQGPGINVITELVIGYLYPGKPLANVAFKTYGLISMGQALGFLADFKLGHYMKIPPRSMFIVQVIGTVIANTVYFSTAWWLLETIPNICDTTLLPPSSPWTCPNDTVFYNASIIWGIVGPRRMFGPLGLYSKMNWFFLVGLLAPIPHYLLTKAFPKHKSWLLYVNIPVIFAGAGGLPAAKAVHYTTWAAVGITFNYFVYRRYKGWWARYNYVLSAGLDTGVAFMGVLVYFALQNKGIYGIQWWGQSEGDHCPLATCPTYPGIVGPPGCPNHS